MRYSLKSWSRTGCRACMCQVPPSPGLLAQLRARYLALKSDHRLPAEMTFEQYYSVWRSSRRGSRYIGLDDGATTTGPANPNASLIDRRLDSSGARSGPSYCSSTSPTEPTQLTGAQAFSSTCSLAYRVSRPAACATISARLAGGTITAVASM